MRVTATHLRLLAIAALGAGALLVSGSSALAGRAGISTAVPLSGTVSGWVPWAVTPTASTPRSVRFLVDGVLWQTDTTAPFRYDDGATGMFDTSTLANGAHRLKAVATYSGTSRTTSTSVKVTVANPNGKPSGGSACAQGTYQTTFYSGTTVSGKQLLSRCDAAIDFAWQAAAPAAGVPSDNFSARFQGKIPLGAGSYTFTTTSDDGIRLYVDGVLLLDRWLQQSATSYSATITLGSGVHDVRLDYEEITGWASVKLAVAPAAPPQNATAPQVSGTAGVGSTLTASPGTWYSAPSRYAYRWQRCDAAGDPCRAIDGAAASSYTAGSADVGSSLRVDVTATNDAGSATATSAPTATVADAPDGVAPTAGSVSLSGSAVAGGTLTATPSGFDPGSPAATYAYAWRACAAATDAFADCGSTLGTGSSFSPGTAAIGRFVVAQVTATNSCSSGCGSAVAVSPASSQVSGVAPAAGTVALSGIARAGQTLTGTPTGFSAGTPAGTYAYAWRACASAADAFSSCGATLAATASYAVTAGDVGRYLKLEVSVANVCATGCASASAVSSASAQVAAAPTATTLFNDDFDGTSGSKPDSAKWIIHPDNCEQPNNYSCLKGSNVFLDGSGNLVLRLRRETSNYLSGGPYSGAWVNTFAYGTGWPPSSVKAAWPVPYRIEARIRYPNTPGAWSGPWNMNVDRPTSQNISELDWGEERMSFPTTFDCHQHTWLSGKDVAPWDCGGRTVTHMGQNFHTIAAEVRSTGVTYSVDGVAVRTAPGVSGTHGLIINSAIGAPGTWGAGGGAPAASDPGPWDLLVDYVRVTSLA